MLHCNNVCFEEEVATERELSLQELLTLHPNAIQMQYLPLSFIEEDEGVFVTEHLIEDRRTKLHPSCYKELKTWGYSRAAAAFAKEHGLMYKCPPWDVVKKVTSKEFSFSLSPKLPNASLLYSAEELAAWEASFPGEKIIKSCYGFSGRGHMKPTATDRIAKEWALGRPVIAEPFVNRLLDFSTQWEIDESGEISFVGTTVCRNTRGGGYLGTLVGNLESFFAPFPGLFEKHCAVCRPLLEQVALLGYFGPIGVDAMIHGNGDLHPIVELNPRQTMGLFAIKLFRIYSSLHTLEIRYGRNGDCLNGVLPSHLGSKPFQKQLEVITWTH